LGGQIAAEEVKPKKKPGKTFVLPGYEWEFYLTENAVAVAATSEVGRPRIPAKKLVTGPKADPEARMMVTFAPFAVEFVGTDVPMSVQVEV
jgi:hypothetical protein